MAYRYYCNECGFEAITDFSYSSVKANTLVCPECGEGHLIEEKVESNINDLNLIEEMKDTIEKIGESKVWNNIEKEKDPLQRMASRRLFFRAGGKLV